MPNEEQTLPPVRQPNTIRTLVPRAWRWCVEVIGKHPDKALVMFLLALAVAVIF